MAVNLDRTQLERAGRELIVPGMKNQLYDEMPLFRMMVENGDTAQGTALIHPVALFKTVATGLVGGYGTMVTQDQPLIVQATLSWSQLYYANISISLDEMDENTGPIGATKIVDILKTKTNAAKSKIKEQVYQHLFDDLTADGVGYKTLVGILAAVGSTSNTYANINRSTTANAGWKPNVYSTTVADDDTLLNPTARDTYLPSIIRREWLLAAHDKAPNIIVTTKNLYELLQFIGERNNLVLQGNTSSLSFGKVTMPNSTAQQGQAEPPVFWDSYCPDKHVFGLSTPGWKAWKFPNRDFDAVDLFGDGHIWQRGDKQVAGYMTIGWKGQILCEVPRENFACTTLGE
jgi:hypothetical protein